MVQDINIPDSQKGVSQILDNGHLNDEDIEIYTEERIKGFEKEDQILSNTTLDKVKR